MVNGQAGPCMGRCMGGVQCGVWVHVHDGGGVGECMWLVRLDLGVGGGVDGDGEEVVDVVSYVSIFAWN